MKTIALALSLASGLSPSLPRLDVQDLPAPPQAAATLRFDGFISVWSQDCGPACGLPWPLIKNDAAGLVLALPEKPGEFRAGAIARRYRTEAGDLNVKASVYAVCPRGPAAAGCPARYFTVQLELSGAASALCSATLNEADVSPFPVLACGGPAGSLRLGATLHRAPL